MRWIMAMVIQASPLAVVAWSSSVRRRCRPSQATAGRGRKPAVPPLPVATVGALARDWPGRWDESLRRSG